MTPAPLRDQAAMDRQAVAACMQAAGMRILNQAWRHDGRSLDVVAAQDRTLIICHIKSAETGDPVPDGLLTQGQKTRLRRTAASWMIANGVIFGELRIDVAIVVTDAAGARCVAAYQPAAG